MTLRSDSPPEQEAPPRSNVAAPGPASRRPAQVHTARDRRLSQWVGSFGIAPLAHLVTLSWPASISEHTAWNRLDRLVRAGDLAAQRLQYRAVCRQCQARQACGCDPPCALCRGAHGCRYTPVSEWMYTLTAQGRAQLPSTLQGRVPGRVAQPW